MANTIKCQVPTNKTNRNSRNQFTSRMYSSINILAEFILPENQFYFTQFIRVVFCFSCRCSFFIFNCRNLKKIRTKLFFNYSFISSIIQGFRPFSRIIIFPSVLIFVQHNNILTSVVAKNNLAHNCTFHPSTNNCCIHISS